MISDKAYIYTLKNKINIIFLPRGQEPYVEKTKIQEKSSSTLQDFFENCGCMEILQYWKWGDDIVYVHDYHSADITKYNYHFITEKDREHV